MKKNFVELEAENELLRQELKVAREASDITAKLVVKQFEQTEQMLHRFQTADSERQAVLDAATGLSIISTDLEGNIKLFSRGASLLFGYSAREMVDKCNILSLHLDEELHRYGKDIFTKIDSPLAAMKLFEQYVKQKRTAAGQWNYIRKDGTSLPVALSVTPLHDGEGHMVGYLFTAMDMTARKMLEHELTNAKEAAESANASKGDFLARMSHEIRTPMNGIIGMSHLLQKTDLNSHQHNYVEKVLGSANTLLKLINDILDFSKIDAGKLKLEKTPFTLENILNNLVNIVGLQADAKGLELLFKIAPEVPDKIVGDPLRLGQILMNLSSNAVKFTEKGEIVISIGVEKFQPPKARLRFSVRDSGIGLPPEQIDQLFEAFNQADDTITRKFGGSGLGLAICKQLVEMMGGEIWAQSEPGRGSEFTFTASFGLPAETDENLMPPATGLTGLRALVVDDNAIAREVLTTMLSTLKMETDSVADGIKAINLLEKATRQGRAYDLVLLDWQMPGIDGIETARRIKAHGNLAQIPAMLMVTANNREEIREEAESVGLDAFLLKPVYASVMYDTIAQTLGIETINGTRNIRNNRENLAALKELRGARVLLVEDNQINQEVAVGFLQDVGIEVEIAAHGQAGVDAALAKPFDLILMDVQMPGMDGLEATRIIRQFQDMEVLPIVAMTAHAMAGDREKSLAAGMNDHLNKPVDPTELYQILLQLISAKSQVPNFLLPPPLSQADKADTADPELPPVPGIDYTEAFRRLGHKPQLLLKLLHDFRHNFAATVYHLEERATADDWPGVLDLLHTLKGVAGYIGARNLSRDANRLEKVIKRKKSEPAKPLLLDFTKQLDELLQALALLPDRPAEIEVNRIEAGSSVAKPDELEKRLHSLMLQLRQGELVSEQQLEEIKDIARVPELAGSIRSILEFIEDIEYEAAADKITQFLTEREANKGVTKS